jgi:hypothetical protein
MNIRQNLALLRDAHNSGFFKPGIRQQSSSSDNEVIEDFVVG